MIDCLDFYNELKKIGIDFFTGVPGSILNDLCSMINMRTSSDKHIITANEGNAIALAAGYYLANKKIALVYMQNSGLCNALNPLTSLVCKDVYSIPVLLIIGWRGAPGEPDEPQHKMQGKITLKLLKILNIPYIILPKSLSKIKKRLKKSIAHMLRTETPYAIVVKKNIFSPYSIFPEYSTKYKISREEALHTVLSSLKNDYVVISTTGRISREIYQYRELYNESHEKDFLSVGSMRHASQIALGIAISKKNINVYCIDGDGSLVMHMGSLGINALLLPKNFRHIILNNGAHDSVGGQATVGFKINFPAVARACGYKYCLSVDNNTDLIKMINFIKKNDGPIFLEIKIRTGDIKKIGRPKNINKDEFMEYLKNIE